MMGGELVHRLIIFTCGLYIYQYWYRACKCEWTCVWWWSELVHDNHLPHGHLHDMFSVCASVHNMCACGCARELAHVCNHTHTCVYTMWTNNAAVSLLALYFQSYWYGSLRPYINMIDNIELKVILHPLLEVCRCLNFWGGCFNKHACMRSLSTTWLMRGVCKEATCCRIWTHLSINLGSCFKLWFKWIIEQVMSMMLVHVVMYMRPKCGSLLPI